MILLDTHIWVWWVDGGQRLTTSQKQILKENELNGLGVSVISCWESAKLVEYGRLALACSIEEWMEKALAYPGIQLIELTPQIAIESTKLPGNFHRALADQMIVATARVYDIPLLTVDDRILNYPHVRTLT
jgi:PIN domain nuclease of toxin-antitoxin system